MYFNFVNLLKDCGLEIKIVPNYSKTPNKVQISLDPVLEESQPDSSEETGETTIGEVIEQTPSWTLFINQTQVGTNLFHSSLPNESPNITEIIEQHAEEYNYTVELDYSLGVVTIIPKLDFLLPSFKLISSDENTIQTEFYEQGYNGLVFKKQEDNSYIPKPASPFSTKYADNTEGVKVTEESLYLCLGLKENLEPICSNPCTVYINNTLPEHQINGEDHVIWKLYINNTLISDDISKDGSDLEEMLRFNDFRSKYDISTISPEVYDDIDAQFSHVDSIFYFAIKNTSDEILNFKFEPNTSEGYLDIGATSFFVDSSSNVQVSNLIHQETIIDKDENGIQTFCLSPNKECNSTKIYQTLAINDITNLIKVYVNDEEIYSFIENQEINFQGIIGIYVDSASFITILNNNVEDVSIKLVSSLNKNLSDWFGDSPPSTYDLTGNTVTFCLAKSDLVDQTPCSLNLDTVLVTEKETSDKTYVIANVTVKHSEGTEKETHYMLLKHISMFNEDCLNYIDYIKFINFLEPYGIVLTRSVNESDQKQLQFSFDDPTIVEENDFEDWTITFQMLTSIDGEFLLPSESNTTTDDFNDNNFYNKKFLQFCITNSEAKSTEEDIDTNLEKDATPAIRLDLPKVIPRTDSVYKAKGKVVGLETFKNLTMTVKLGASQKNVIQKESYEVDQYGNFEIKLDLSLLQDGRPYIELLTVNTRDPSYYLDRIFNNSGLSRSSDMRIDDPLIVKIDLKDLESEEIVVYTMSGSHTEWTVDWGDGTTTTKSDSSLQFEAKHVYKNTGESYICKVYSENTAMSNFGIGNWEPSKGVGKDTYSLVEVLSFGTAGYPSFRNCRGLVDVPTYIPKSTGKKLDVMFYYASNFNSPNILKWDWTNVEYVGSMLGNASSFEQDMSNITIHVNQSKVYASRYNAPYGFADGTKLTEQMYPKFIYTDS